MTATLVREGNALREGRISREWLETLAQRVSRPGGGFTLDVIGGSRVAEGFAVSVYPEREQRLTGRVVWHDLMAYTRANIDLLRKPGVRLGAWHDAGTGVVFLDVVLVLESRERACALGVAHGQVAVFDLGAGRVIRLPRSGRAA